MNIAQGMTADDEYKQQLRSLFQTCRTAALDAGIAEGHSEAEIDAKISELCDADVENMQAAPDDDFRQFARECGLVVKQFLAKI